MNFRVSLLFSTFHYMGLVFNRTRTILFDSLAPHPFYWDHLNGRLLKAEYYSTRTNAWRTEVTQTIPLGALCDSVWGLYVQYTHSILYVWVHQCSNKRKSIKPILGAGTPHHSTNSLVSSIFSASLCYRHLWDIQTGSAQPFTPKFNLRMWVLPPLQPVLLIQLDSPPYTHLLGWAPGPGGCLTGRWCPQY